MNDASAVVVGGGIGGLCAAIGLRRRGWDVTVLERAPRFGEVGAGLTLMANGLRGLDALGLGEAVRAQGRVDASGGTRTPDGRWLSRVDGTAMTRLLGTAAVGIHRAALHRVLRDALPPAALVTDAEVVAVDGGGAPVDAADVGADPRPVVRYRHGGRELTRSADLVVAADGIRSAVRARLWPEVPPPVYAGSTAWRGVTDRPWPGPPLAAVTWGRGTEFGMVPLGDGRVYWFAAVTAPAGWRTGDADQLALVRQRVGAWHDPVPALLDATSPAGVIRSDLHHLPGPVPTFHRGAVALLGDAAHAMTPNLGQGACQAIEDAAVLAAVCRPGAEVGAALAGYDRQRRPRAQRVARASRQVGRLGQQLRHPVAVAARNAIMRLTPARVALRSMARYADWTAPDIPADGFPASPAGA